MTDIISANLVDEIADQADDVEEAITNVSTTAALAAIGNAINTTGKFIGKQVFNTTTSILVIAVGPAADDVWANSGTGVTAHTPA